MKKQTLNINQLVKKVIEESLQEKADDLALQVSMKMNEWNPNGPVTISGTDMSEQDDVEKRLCDKDSPEYDEERCQYNKNAKMGGMDTEIDEITSKDLVKGKKYKYKTPSFDDELEYEDKMEYPEGKPMYGFKGKKAHHAMGDKHIEDYLSDMDSDELGEELIGGQKKLDKNKNGKLDAEDFKMLRKKQENEQFDIEDEYDEDYTSKKKDRYTAFDKIRMGQEPEDIEWEEISNDELDEEEMEEGNAFTGALAKAKEEGEDEFEVGGKKYHVKEGKKFIQKAVKKMEKKGTEGSFKEYCGGEVTKSCIDKALKSKDAELVKKANFAKNIKAYKGATHKKKSVKESIELTESELIDLIEKIVMEEKKPTGLAQTEKVLNADKKQNDDYLKSVTKKMKEYLKDGSKGSYEENPKNFPMGNGQLSKMSKKAYTPSDAVDEYIDAFAYPGQTNLVFDEIKPDDEKIEKYLKGHKTTGNAEVDEDGKSLGNVVPSKTGEKFNKNYKENLYGQEQMNASYKRYPQDTIEVAGDVTKKGKLSKKTKKTAQSVLNKVEESKTKEDILLNEEFNRMKNLMGYSKVTQ